MISSILLYTLLTIVIILSTAIVWPFFILKNLPFILKRAWISIGISVFFLFLDLFTKNLAVSHLKFNSKVLIPGWLSLEYTKNFGAAFGILPHKNWIFIGVAVITVFTFFLLSVNSKNESVLMKVSYGFLIAGSLGNLYDRLHFGYVIDFINLQGFPIFNVADLCIDIGLFGIIALTMFRDRILRRRNAPNFS